MKIDVANQRILLLRQVTTHDEAIAKARDKKTTAFDTLSKVTSFLSRPKEDDFELTYEEHRFQPFWHVAANARYVYDRSATYQIPVSSVVVQKVTVNGTDYDQTNGHIHVPVMEHCTQSEADEVFVDGVSGKNTPDLKKYSILTSEIVKDSIEKLVPKGSIIVPPTTRVSAIMRDSLSKMIKGIQADTIIEEQVSVSRVDLYYRPIFAFEFNWISKNKKGIVEVDGLTGEVQSGNRVFREYLGKVLDRNFLFDIGADAAGIFVPGGNIAVKAVKRYIDTKK